MRRAFVGAVAMLVLALAAAGCTAAGPGAAPTPASSTTSPSASGSSGSSAPPVPVTLRFAVYGDAQTVDVYRSLADAYTALHPEVTIVLQHSRDRLAAAQRLDRQFAHGRAPDVFLAGHQQMPELVAKLRVHPVDQLLEKRGVLFGDNYQRVGLEAFSADSALQCMPHDVSPLVVFYNKRLLRPRTLARPGEDPVTVDNGWTWEQFATAARRLSHGDVKGVYLPPELETLLPLVRSAGADLVDDDRAPSTLTLSDGGARAALERVLQVARDPQLTPSPDELSRHDPVRLFEDGRIGMLVGTRRLVPKLREATGLRFDVFPLPSLGKPRTITEMTGYCIAAHTPHLEQAADFLTYATSTEGEKITARLGGIVPANLPALHSDAFLQPGSEPRHAGVFSDTLQRADAPPFVPGWPVLEQQLQPLLDKLFYAPVLNLDRLLPRMDRRSRTVLAPPSPSPAS